MSRMDRTESTSRITQALSLLTDFLKSGDWDSARLVAKATKQRAAECNYYLSEREELLLACVVV